jgi:hypothetical protein
MLPDRKFQRRTAELATGFLTWNILDNAFDYALYPFVIWKLGPWIGGAIMTVLSLLFCLFLLRLYDRLGRDWLGIEFVKNLRHYEGTSRWRRWLAWLVSQGDAVAFVVLSVKYDPFITTAYMRHEAYKGMSRRDWIIFLGSWLLANGLWIAVCYGGVSFLQFLF